MCVQCVCCCQTKNFAFPMEDKTFWESVNPRHSILHYEIITFTIHSYINIPILVNLYHYIRNFNIFIFTLLFDIDY